MHELTSIFFLSLSYDFAVGFGHVLHEWCAIAIDFTRAVCARFDPVSASRICSDFISWQSELVLANVGSEIKLTTMSETNFI